jgi:hypothetical protein
MDYIAILVFIKSRNINFSQLLKWYVIICNNKVVSVIDLCESDITLIIIYHINSYEKIK